MNVARVWEIIGALKILGVTTDKVATNVADVFDELDHRLKAKERVRKELSWLDDIMAAVGDGSMADRRITAEDERLLLSLADRCESEELSYGDPDDATPLRASELLRRTVDELRRLRGPANGIIPTGFYSKGHR